jgi:uncharacterized protein YqfB (UPF0267 family)
MFQGVSFAKIYYDTDKFDGHKWYYTTNSQDKDMFNLLEPYYNIDTTFNLVQCADGSYSPNMILDYTTNDVYSIEPTIKIRIDDTIFTITSNSNSSLSNGSVSEVWSVEGNFYKALINTKNTVSVRFNYHDLTGVYTKDYKLKYKFIKEVQDMYNTYGKQ